MRRRLLAGTLALLTACGGGADGGDAEGTAAATRVPVGVGTIVRDSLVETLALAGRLEARPGGAALLTAPAAGLVRSVRVQIGDRVARGGLVAELDVPELAADAAQKSAAAAQADRESARQQQLLADGITSARQAEEAAANARQAAAAAAAAGHLLARTAVTSPVAGRVQDVTVQRGERVEVGRALAQVVAGDTLDLIVPAPMKELARLRTGLPVEVVQDGTASGARGWVAALAPGVDSLTNAGKVVIRVPNPDGRLQVGAAAIGHVRLGVRTGILVAPDSAIVLAGDSSVVFVVGPDAIARQRAVVRGVRREGRSEVTGDLKPGDRVVTTGAFGLQDGMHVAPAPAAAGAAGP